MSSICTFALTACYLHNAAFGFAAALLESIPIVGLAFMVSNRVGAAMWAHGGSPLSQSWRTVDMAPLFPDLEKRQHYVADLKTGAISEHPPQTIKPKAD